MASSLRCSVPPAVARPQHWGSLQVSRHPTAEMFFLRAKGSIPCLLTKEISTLSFRGMLCFRIWMFMTMLHSDWRSKRYPKRKLQKKSMRRWRWSIWRVLKNAGSADSSSVLPLRVLSSTARVSCFLTNRCQRSIWSWERTCRSSLKICRKARGSRSYS